MLARGDLTLFIHQHTLLERGKSKHNLRIVLMYFTINSNQLNGHWTSTWQRSLLPQFTRKVSTRVSRLKHTLTFKSGINLEQSVLVLWNIFLRAFNLFPLRIITLQLKGKFRKAQKNCSSLCHSCLLLWDTEHTSVLA